MSQSLAKMSQNLVTHVYPGGDTLIKIVQKIDTLTSFEVYLAGLSRIFQQSLDESSVKWHVEDGTHAGAAQKLSMKPWKRFGMFPFVPAKGGTEVHIWVRIQWNAFVNDMLLADRPDFKFVAHNRSAVSRMQPVMRLLDAIKIKPDEIVFLFGRGTMGAFLGDFIAARYDDLPNRISGIRERLAEHLDHKINGSKVTNKHIQHDKPRRGFQLRICIGPDMNNLFWVEDYKYLHELAKDAGVPMEALRYGGVNVSLTRLDGNGVYHSIEEARADYARPRG